ncbi:ATP-binding protein [Herminiimonas sp. CN]|uniref:ATP-binding protein n=1 Tax=Herminiimonas sp. CN TaxID=1349818 RepID=UPI0004731A64|nr:ATP-binding protein [Herminiimonas sp. CN]
MHRTGPRFNWLHSGLFWRTFLLLAILMMTSMTVWISSYRVLERTPRARQLAAQVVSIVTITRAALTHSAPDLRRELLFDLASNEGIRIYPLESSDRVEPTPESEIGLALQENIRNTLGRDTHFAGKVNDVAGFWVSFSIEDDEYWLMLERDRIENFTSLQLLGWGASIFGLSLLGALFISGLINQPLARLTAAARDIAKGKQPAPLPEQGPTEIREANRSFNQMVDDLNQIESDRAIILAGISHDLRTPITRMQLEIEMAPLSAEARQGMSADIAQMDAIIGQFLDYARPADAASFSTVDVSALLHDCAREAERLPDLRITTNIAAQMQLRGNQTDLKRVVNNLIENARRYGKTAGTEVAEIDIRSLIENGKSILEIADHGPGVPETEIDRLLRPFTRMDAARGQANGAGLGLAIVQRIVKRHGAQLHLGRGKDGRGLAVRIAF